MVASGRGRPNAVRGAGAGRRCDVARINAAAARLLACQQPPWELQLANSLFDDGSGRTRRPVRPNLLGRQPFLLNGARRPGRLGRRIGPGQVLILVCVHANSIEAQREAVNARAAPPWTPRCRWGRPSVERDARPPAASRRRMPAVAVLADQDFRGSGGPAGVSPCNSSAPSGKPRGASSPQAPRVLGRARPQGPAMSRCAAPDRVASAIPSPRSRPAIVGLRQAATRRGRRATRGRRPTRRRRPPRRGGRRPRAGRRGGAWGRRAARGARRRR